MRFFTAKTDEGWFLGRTQSDPDEAPEVIGAFKTQKQAKVIQKFISQTHFETMQKAYDYLGTYYINQGVAQGMDYFEALQWASDRLYRGAK